MEIGSRKLFNSSFTTVGVLAIVLMAVSLLVLLTPIFMKGMGAFIFRETVENRELMLQRFGRGDREEVMAASQAAEEARAPAYRIMDRFEAELSDAGSDFRREYGSEYRMVRELVAELLGPRPGAREAALIRERYGEVRMDRALIRLDEILKVETYDYSDPSSMGKKVLRPRRELFAGTSLEPLFPLLEENIDSMMKPQWKFYWRFLFDQSKDAHFFGGIWPEMLGTLYLSIGAMIFAIPFGVVAAIYLAEYAGEGRITRLIRVSISSLAGVPSIVFGLFGLAFFINTIDISDSKSVLAGSLTLALLVLPIIIRASEEAIKAVPRGYREAAMSLGGGKWHTVITVVVPAALPGILTSIIVSLGRAAGETAPIIFTAAVSVGKPLAFWQTVSQPTPALPWSIYNLATEHEAVNEIRHVQYGMVLTLVVLVLLLNLTAIIIRKRVSKKLRR
jgi:phosphate transport system permease protein